ncbi:hypothetical protein AOLI_G00107480 [Acnodon oligacanthus]
MRVSERERERERETERERQRERERERERDSLSAFPPVQPCSSSARERRINKRGQHERDTAPYRGKGNLTSLRLQPQPQPLSGAPLFWPDTALALAAKSRAREEETALKPSMAAKLNPNVLYVREPQGGGGGDAGDESSDSDGEQEETCHKLIRKVSTSGQIRAKVRRRRGGGGTWEVLNRWFSTLVLE